MNINTVTHALKNARRTIEQQQDGELEMDQACTIYDLCQALQIDPATVLGLSSLALIDPGQQHAEVLDDDDLQ